MNATPPVQGRRRSPRRVAISWTCALVLLVVATALGLMVGPVPLSLTEVVNGITGTGDPMHTLILQEVRAPRTITALLVGGALGMSGLLMQTLFRNPLADPQVLGVSSGASLGVAFMVLVVGSRTNKTATFTAGLGLSGDVLITVAAGVGAALTMALVLTAGRFLTSSSTLLLLGVMVGYFVSSAVTVMLSAASPELVQQFTMWGFGSYNGVTWANLCVLAPIVVCGMLASALLVKPLNALLLGERYAQTMGVDMRRTRLAIIAVTAILAGTSTAFCGPIAFLGIAIPHLCRGSYGSSDHRVLLPACAVVGGTLALTADILSQLPGQNVLPLNAVNAAFGAPVVIFILLHHQRRLSV